MKCVDWHMEEGQMNKIKKILKRNPKREEEITNEIERGGGIEKKDMSAMLLSAYLTIMPVVILIMATFILISYLYVN